MVELVELQLLGQSEDEVQQGRAVSQEHEEET